MKVSNEQKATSEYSCPPMMTCVLMSSLGVHDGNKEGASTLYSY